MHVRRLAWVGTRTENFTETRDFFRGVLGLTMVVDEPGLAMFHLPGGEHDYVELVGVEDPDAAYMTTGPVPGFLVDDVVQARKELEAAGVEMVEPIRWTRQDPESLSRFGEVAEGDDDAGEVRIARWFWDFSPIG